MWILFFCGFVAFYVICIEFFAVVVNLSFEFMLWIILVELLRNMFGWKEDSWDWICNWIWKLFALQLREIYGFIQRRSEVSGHFTISTIGLVKLKKFFKFWYKTVINCPLETFFSTVELLKQNFGFSSKKWLKIQVLIVKNLVVFENIILLPRIKNKSFLLHFS